MGNEGLKLCLVGCGMIGRIQARAAQKHSDQIRLHLCDAEIERARMLTEELGTPEIFESYQEALSEPTIDAVNFCLPHHLHAEATLSAIEAGKHVLAEIVDKGDIGEPFLIVIQEISFFVEVASLMQAYDRRRRHSTGGGGVLFDRGIHLMATVNQLGDRRGASTR